MNCQDVEPYLSAFVDGELPPDLHSAVAAHLQDCPACRMLCDDLRTLTELAGTLSTPMPSPQVRQTVREALAPARTDTSHDTVPS